MSVILILILASLSTALLFLGAFVWAVRSGQYEDVHTPSVRILAEDGRPASPRPDSRVEAAPPPAAVPGGPDRVEERIYPFKS